jgi:putative endopeptidase
MNVRNLAPLGLTIAIAASLAACGKNETAPATSADATPAFDLSQIKTPLISLNSADLDPAIAACTDLNGFVNSKWLKANPVPGDQTTWGSFEILRERSLEVQHALVQQAAASQAKAGSVEAKIGDIWKTGNDEAKIEAAGLAPLQPQLDKIAALKDTATLTQYLRDSQAEGKGVLFSLFANADYKDSANVIAYVGQGGLGLPEKGYYFDDAQARIRDAYVAYIAQVLTLSGVDAAQAAEQAKAVMAFETRLAKASMSRIEMRDPAKRYNPLSAADADRLTPNFSCTALLDTLKVPAAQKFSLAQPGFFSEMDKMLADVPAIIEQVPHYSVPFWFALMAPKAMPPEPIAPARARSVKSELPAQLVPELAGLEPIALRAPRDKHIELAIDADGRLHIVGRATDAAAILRARGWARAPRTR